MDLELSNKEAQRAIMQKKIWLSMGVYGYTAYTMCYCCDKHTNNYKKHCITKKHIANRNLFDEKLHNLDAEIRELKEQINFINETIKLKEK